jgi:hypothetical protein
MISNVGGPDRILRALLGLALIGYAGMGHTWAWIGLIPLATAVIRFCPAYLPFGWNTCSK